MRYSRQRELIAKLLSDTKSHPTAYEIYDRARHVEPSISLGTVYRNLSEMLSGGMIRQIKGFDSSVHYDADTSSHPHFVCKYCCRVYDIDLIGTDALLPDGWKVDEISVNCIGKCKNCIEKEETNGQEIIVEN